MHELSVAQSLLEIVLQEAARHGVKKVHKISVKVGELSGVVPHSLTFGFDMIKAGTIAEEAVLEITNMPLTGRCQDCGHEPDMSERDFTCDKCGSSSVEITSGRELFIDHIEAD